MECVTGTIKLRNIFLDNGNWWKLFLSHHKLIRFAIIVNVLKLLTCKTAFLGYHLFTCPSCNRSLKVPHSCKSRACSPCGKKATDTWIKNAFNSLPDTTWQHITFTIDALLQPFFQTNRHLINKIPRLAAHIILKEAKKHKFLPGIFLAIHTFGRDLKFNLHIHLSTTTAGLILPDKQQWSKNHYFHHLPLKRQWRYAVISLIRNEFKKGKIKLPPSLSHIKTYSSFNSWLNYVYSKSKEWVVFLNHQSDNKKRNINYLGKYLKRPPISETRISAYNGKNVTFSFLDHYSKKQTSLTIPVLDFLSRFIRHIPDKHFRLIRYYGFLSNRTISTLLPRVRSLLSLQPLPSKKVSLSWHQLIRNTFGYDPLSCPLCKSILQLTSVRFPDFSQLLPFHKEIAHGHFQLI